MKVALLVNHTLKHRRVSVVKGWKTSIWGLISMIPKIERWSRYTGHQAARSQLEKATTA